MRLNKYISDSGYCSRREADELIEMGLVTVNMKRGNPGDEIGDTDEVRIDGARLKNKKVFPIYIALNKATGVTSTTDTSDKSNIIDYVNHPKRIFPIGRLDKDSEGLILLTNDGDIVNKILRSENNHEKEYIVSVDKPLDDTFIRKMSGGLVILGVKTKPCKVKQIGTNKFNIILTQGLNRQIRRMCEALGYRVKSLKRVRIMHIKLDGLKKGQWRNLTIEETEQLMKSIEGAGNSKSRSSSPKAKTVSPKAKTASSKVKTASSQTSTPKARASNPKPKTSNTVKKWKK